MDAITLLSKCECIESCLKPPRATPAGGFFLLIFMCLSLQLAEVGLPHITQALNSQLLQPHVLLAIVAWSFYTLLDYC